MNKLTNNYNNIIQPLTANISALLASEIRIKEKNQEIHLLKKLHQIHFSPARQELKSSCNTDYLLILAALADVMPATNIYQSIGHY